METKKPVLIECPNCRQKTPLKIEKVFDDQFRPIGEKKICSFCKFVFETEEIPIVHERTLNLFDPKAERHICQYCMHYVVNPWTQKCMLWNKEVTATDSCPKYEKRKQL
jgi:hypothetical protein